MEVVCCRLTPLQLELYCHFLQSKATRTLFATQKASRVLSAITSLRKLLNHPKVGRWCVCVGVLLLTLQLIYDALHSNAKPDAGAQALRASGVGCMHPLADPLGRGAW